MVVSPDEDRLRGKHDKQKRLLENVYVSIDRAHFVDHSFGGTAVFLNVDQRF